MGLIDCPACSGTVSYEASSCPHCGKPYPGKIKFESKFSDFEKYFMIFVIVFLVVFWIGIIIF